MYDGEPAEEKDIDFSKAYKTYVDLDIFQKEKLSEEELEKMIQESPVVWTVPVYYDEATCLVEVSKGLPLDKENEDDLTEEQKEQIINAEGKWTVVSCSFEDGHVDRLEAVSYTHLYQRNSWGQSLKSFIVWMRRDIVRPEVQDLDLPLQKRL